MTRDDILAEYWAHKYFDDPKLKDEVEDEDFDMEEVLQQMEENPDDWEPV